MLWDSPLHYPTDSEFQEGTDLTDLFCVYARSELATEHKSLCMLSHTRPTEKLPQPRGLPFVHCYILNAWVVPET